MDIYWETVKLMTDKKSVKKGIDVLFLLILFVAGCSTDNDRKSGHYFLNGYDHLGFYDREGNPVPPSNFISIHQVDGIRSYKIRDTSLVLLHNRSKEPYSGYIRTFHNERYNLQGEFEDGKMFRLRYWHPNRTLGMDMKYEEKVGSVWNSSGNLVASMNPEETYYYYLGSQDIKEIVSDTMHSYYTKSGELKRYTVRNDTAIINYDSKGDPRSILSFREGKGLHGPVRQYYPNGQLKMEGMHENGNQTGIWIEYDSLGNEIKRENYN